MRNILHKNHFQKIFGFILLLSILSGSFSIGEAQMSFRANQTPTADRNESYAQLFRKGRGADFTALLAKSVGATEVENVENWLDKNNAGFFRTFDAAFQNETKRVFEEKREKNKPSQSGIAPKTTAPKQIVPAKRKPGGARRASFDSSNSVFFQNASYNPASGNLFNQASEELSGEPRAAEDVAITKIETDDGFQMKGSMAEKTKIVGDTPVTQGATGETRMIMVEGGSIGTEYKAVEFAEAVDKKERTSLRTETTMSWRVLTAMCPDADGISAGSATMTIAVKKTITTPQTIGILTRDVTTRMTIKGFVNDAAELTHFDLEGAATETISGYERAERLGLIENSEYVDGTKQINYEAKNNKIGKDFKDDYGFTKKIGDEMGELKMTTSSPDVSALDERRINEFAALGTLAIYQQASFYLEWAQKEWRNGGCVEVILTTPKMKLLASETAEVSAETVHKFDKSKVNAELTSKTAIASAMPEKYAAVTQGSFVLTAPSKGEKAYISVESVSRRGINFAMLNFDEERLAKKPPPKKTPPAKSCGAWSGKITAVKRKRRNVTKPADGRLVRQVENSEETFSIDYHVLGIQDTTKGFANGYFADAQMNYRRTEYSESNYAADKMMCNKQTIWTTQTIKMESLMTALSSKKITVYVSLGEKGILTFGSPEVNAERIITRTYESSCESYNRVNSSVDRDENLIGVPSPSFEIRFDLDEKSRYLLVGSKTIEESDGSQIIVTWNLTRDCK